jgi:hypothetical protein
MQIKLLCRHLLRVGVVWIASTLIACGGGESSTDRFEEAAREAQRSTVPPSTTEDIDGPDDSSPEQPATTLDGALRLGDSLLAGVDGYKDVLGSDVKALRYMQQFSMGSSSYASLQYQDPAAPQNVDQRDWRNGKVGDPQPVRLTMAPGSTLEENLFAMSEVDWSAIATALPGAPALVEQKLGTTFENSDGVTHIIATKDLPFSSETVVRVYVDGGDRANGGYVEYLADGTLGEVQA